MSYAQPSDLIARYDARRLGDLVKDDGTRATASALLTDTNLQAALDDASGMIDAACQRGQRYTPTDLTNVAAGSDPLNPSLSLTNSQKLLIRLTCDLAYGLLVGRRAFSASDTNSQAPRYAEALKLLDLLEQGEWVFTTAGALAAGIPVTGVVISSQIGLISSITRIFGDLSVYPNQQFSPFGNQ